jgi:hypothetical protein
MKPAKVLMYQSVGFLAIAALTWINECTNLHTLIFGNHPYISDFRESALEMLFILAVWFIVYRCTRRLFSHMRYLEGMMRVCSWCRRVGCNGHWMPLEEFFEKRLHATTSHSICEECLEEQQLEFEKLSVQIGTPLRRG